MVTLTLGPAFRADPGKGGFEGKEVNAAFNTGDPLQPLLHPAIGTVD